MYYKASDVREFIIVIANDKPFQEAFDITLNGDIGADKANATIEYLIEEKHYPFSTTDKYFAEQAAMNSYPLFVCGQMVLLESPELAAALSALSQMEQEIIFLYYFQRLTHREIGRRYGRAGNTTGRRIQMILRRLRAELEGLSYEPATSL